jgi:hypothetical protein
MTTATLDRPQVGYKQPTTPWNGLTVTDTAPNDVGSECETEAWNLASAPTRPRIAHAAVANSMRAPRIVATIRLLGAAPARLVEPYDGASSMTKPKRSGGSWSPAIIATFVDSPNAPSGMELSSCSRWTTITAPVSTAAFSASAATKQSACSPTTPSYWKARSATSSHLPGSASSSRSFNSPAVAL